MSWSIGKDLKLRRPPSRNSLWEKATLTPKFDPGSQVAQSVERWTSNQKVTGSIPGIGSVCHMNPPYQNWFAGIRIM